MTTSHLIGTSFSQNVAYPASSTTTGQEYPMYLQQRVEEQIFDYRRQSNPMYMNSTSNVGFMTSRTTDLFHIQNYNHTTSTAGFNPENSSSSFIYPSNIEEDRSI